MSAVGLSYRDEVVSVLRGLQNTSELSNIRLGIAGSVARGSANKINPTQWKYSPCNRRLGCDIF